MESCQSGRMGHPAKVLCLRVPRVRIPNSPHITKNKALPCFLLCFILTIQLFIQLFN